MVSRDLKTIHATWGERFGVAFDMAHELGSAVGLHGELLNAPRRAPQRGRDRIQPVRLIGGASGRPLHARDGRVIP